MMLSQDASILEDLRHDAAEIQSGSSCRFENESDADRAQRKL